MNNFPHHKLTEQDRKLVDAVRERLLHEKYGVGARINYVTSIRRFLASQQLNSAQLAAFTHDDLSRYLDTLKLRRKVGPYPDNLRRMHRASVKFLFDTIRNEWPKRSLTKLEATDGQLIKNYDTWLVEVRGLSTMTRKNHCRELRYLLQHLHKCRLPIASTTLRTLDRYLEVRMERACRRSKGSLVSTIRGVVRYLHSIGKLERDFSRNLHGPRIYKNETIPTAPDACEVTAALQQARKDHSIRGLRDCALFELLAAYGMRVGELVRLRLDDIDWARERIRIRHYKTGSAAEYPLMRRPANALIRYLRKGRPRCSHREIFITLMAPYVPLAPNGGPAALWRVLARYFNAAGILRVGHRGAHSIRHSRAVGLMRRGASLKEIGDLLGHRAVISTMTYLKLATEDLRSVALDSPSEVRP